MSQAPNSPVVFQTIHRLFSFLSRKIYMTAKTTFICL